MVVITIVLKDGSRRDNPSLCSWVLRMLMVFGIICHNVNSFDKGFIGSLDKWFIECILNSTVNTHSLSSSPHTRGLFAFKDHCWMPFPVLEAGRLFVAGLLDLSGIAQAPIY
jgi:hypothetical protein